MGSTNADWDDALFQRIYDMSMFTTSCPDIFVDNRLSRNFASALCDDRLTVWGGCAPMAVP